MRSFLAIDRVTLAAANTTAEERGFSEEQCVLVTSHEACHIWFTDGQGSNVALDSCGFVNTRMSAEDAVCACVNLDISNMSFVEMCRHEFVYWPTFNSWAEEHMQAVSEREEKIDTVYYPTLGT